MKIRNLHERAVAAPPERIAVLLADLGRVWPAHIAPAPARTATARTPPGR